VCHRGTVGIGLRRGVGGAARVDGQGGKREFEFCEANHGGLVVIKQGAMIRAGIYWKPL
jgi:hypothetical protein